jgi:hypothetical protein
MGAEGVVENLAGFGFHQVSNRIKGEVPLQIMHGIHFFQTKRTGSRPRAKDDRGAPLFHNGEFPNPDDTATIHGSELSPVLTMINPPETAVWEV